MPRSRRIRRSRVRPIVIRRWPPSPRSRRTRRSSPIAALEPDVALGARRRVRARPGAGPARRLGRGSRIAPAPDHEYKPRHDERSSHHVPPLTTTVLQAFSARSRPARDHARRRFDRRPLGSTTIAIQPWPRAPQGGSEPIEDGCGAPTKIHSMDSHRVIEPRREAQITASVRRGGVRLDQNKPRPLRTRSVCGRARESSRAELHDPEGVLDAIPKIEMITYGGRRQKSSGRVWTSATTRRASERNTDDDEYRIQPRLEGAGVRSAMSRVVPGRTTRSPSFRVCSSSNAVVTNGPRARREAGAVAHPAERSRPVREDDGVQGNAPRRSPSHRLASHAGARTTEGPPHGPAMGERWHVTPMQM